MGNAPPALTPEILLRAYAMGVFPMAEHQDAPDIFWVNPEWRGILPLADFHISKSLTRRIRRGEYRVTLNTSFEGVLDACADRSETWINREIHCLYKALHEQGHAHSIEIHQDGVLTGGAYGVAIGGVFFGESMFSRRTDASKLALAHLTDHLLRCGFRLLDTQFITPHLTSLGAQEISRAAYHVKLADAIAIETSIHALPLDQDFYSVLQRNTQRA